MAVSFARRPLLAVSLLVAVSTVAHAQAAPTGLTGATAAWTLKVPGGGDIRWQQVTPAGILLVSTDAARPGLLVVFDPVTGATVFDSRKLSLTQVVTRRVLPQSGTLLVHGRRASGPPVVALYDLVTGDQRWASESLFQQSGPPKRGLGGLMQGLV